MTNIRFRNLKLACDQKLWALFDRVAYTNIPRHEDDITDLLNSEAFDIDGYITEKGHTIFHPIDSEA